ncbi:hypothetical protein OH76DRAFT_1456274 [Lentinus brumalis]|uniref:CxC2-like cysteine cluster KDZ transposase-associated domain-containing protein n=1 Tax=Lentinus brumalis TaxID=2498619 RepID=A0A371D7S2_9APHY|nr:hypothetical protein OH76DRAFT_1456274 [Polyporus brumalis]
MKDRPLLQWMRRIPEYLAELLRLEGRGDHTGSQCKGCGTVGDGTYRCEDCWTTCMYCQVCIVERHVTSPLHRIQVWKGGHFEVVTLKSLGLRVQLGHDPGDRCFHPQRAHGDDFVVLDVHGIHEVGLDFCGCPGAQRHTTQLLRVRWFPATSVDPRTAATFAMLEHFHLLSMQSKLSGWEFYTCLARRTDNTGTEEIKDRYPAFMQMVRQWRHLKLLKRSGRGHDPDGVAATRPGSCAVECPACPQPEKNLPQGWENAPKWKRWLYQLYISLDANFRLKRKKVSCEESDPSLNDGIAYMVKEQQYKAFLEATGNLPPEKHTHCNNHNAVKLANLKNGALLAATGVGAVDCARHGFRRPASIGDLQKGERYANMDYLLMSTLCLTIIPWIVATYDIACQFGINLHHRFDEVYGWRTWAGRSLRWAIPKFHIAAHREYCRGQYSLHYLPLLGRYDGEAIERNWGGANPMASSTKEMGPGSRRDALDDAFGDSNWYKVVKLPASLLEKMKLAVPQRNEHVSAFKQYNDALPAEHTALWTEQVEAWEADLTQPNPFLVTRPTITESSIRKKLLEEDAEALRLGREVILHEDFSSSTMLSAGIDLEEHQLAGLHEHATDLARAKVQDRQNTLHRKLDAWFKVQQLSIPGVIARRSQIMTTPTMQLAHKIPLLLPSQAMLFLEVDVKLLQQEWALREAQAYDALADIRGLLELRCHLYQIKDRWVRGQGANTRAMSSIAGVQYKIDMAAQRYRCAQNAMSCLSPRLGKDLDGWRRVLRPLEDCDLRHASEDENTTESTRTISWIWKHYSTAEQGQVPAAGEASANVNARAQGSLQESVRSEWCKARARAHRWAEEVLLLLEEMRRVLEYHEWAACEWERRADANFEDRPDYQEGARAYALRQASIRRALKTYAQHAWRNVQEYVNLLESIAISSTPSLSASLLDLVSLASSSSISVADSIPDLVSLASSSSLSLASGGMIGGADGLVDSDSD